MRGTESDGDDGPVWVLLEGAAAVRADRVRLAAYGCPICGFCAGPRVDEAGRPALPATASSTCAGSSGAASEADRIRRAIEARAEAGIAEAQALDDRSLLDRARERRRWVRRLREAGPGRPVRRAPVRVHARVRALARPRRVTVALGLTTAVMWALTDLCNLVMTRRAGAYAGAFWLLACGIVPLLPAALLAEDWPAHVPADAVLAAVAAGVLDAVAVLCLLRALAVGSLALVAPLAALEGGVAALGAIALGADTTVLIAVGLALAVAGGALAVGRAGRARRATHGGRRRAGRSLSALAFGVVLLLLDPATELGNLNATLVMRVAATVALLPVALRRGSCGSISGSAGSRSSRARSTRSGSRSMRPPPTAARSRSRRSAQRSSRRSRR